MIVPQKKELCTIHPGEWYFGGDYIRLYTLLGSCVSLTAWHPGLKIGGLCHYLLPVASYDSSASRSSSVTKNDYRYADKVLAAMKSAMLKFAPLKEFELGVFGGGDMFAYSGATSIGFDNIAYVRQWLMQERLEPVRVDVGGAISRSLTLTLTTGEIRVKQYHMNRD